MPVTPTSYNGAPITNDADAPSVAISKLGQAELAYRQPYATGSPLPGPRIFLNTLPDGESESGAQFLGAAVADPGVGGGRLASIGRPSVDVDERRETRVLYDSNGQPRVVERDRQGSAQRSRASARRSRARCSAPRPNWRRPRSCNPEGGGVSAWPSSDARGRPGVGVREDFPNGAVQTALVSGGAGGPIGEIAVGRSGLGDGLVAFQQGPIGNAAIVGAQVTAPPAPFAVTLPENLDQALADCTSFGRPAKARTARSSTSWCSTAGSSARRRAASPTPSPRARCRPAPTMCSCSRATSSARRS